MYLQLHAEAEYSEKYRTITGINRSNRKSAMNQLITTAVLLLLMILIAYMIYDEHQYKDDAEEIPVIGGNTPAKYSITRAINPDFSEQYPRASGILCNNAGKEYIFIGGRANESDIIYSCVDNKSGETDHKIIPIVKLPKYKSVFSTACVILRLRNCEYDDIIIARTDGIYLLAQKTFMEFAEIKLWDCPRAVYVTCLSVGDIAKNGNVFIFAGCSRVVGACGSIANVSAPNRIFLLNMKALAAGPMTVSANIFTDITDKFPGVKCATTNTIAGTFADFSGNGFPDLLIVNAMSPGDNDAGKIILFRNINGNFTRQYLSPRGDWGGIALGDVDGSGRVSIIATSAGYQSRIIATITRKPITRHIIIANRGDYQFDIIESGGDADNSDTDIIFPANIGHCGNGIIADINDSGKTSIICAGNNQYSLIHRAIPQLRTGCVAWLADDDDDDSTISFTAKRMYRNRDYAQNILLADLAGCGCKNIICINKLGAPRVFAIDDEQQQAKKYINVVVDREVSLLNCIIELKFKDGSVSAQQFITGSGANCSNIFHFGLADKSPLTLTIRVNRGRTPTEYMLDRLIPGATYRVDQFTRI